MISAIVDLDFLLGGRVDKSTTVPPLETDGPICKRPGPIERVLDPRIVVERVVWACKPRTLHHTIGSAEGLDALDRNRGAPP